MSIDRKKTVGPDFTGLCVDELLETAKRLDVDIDDDDKICLIVVELREMKFPVLCRGIAPNVACTIGFGYINVPVQCGGAAVSPGDIVIVDDNGVAVVPQNEAEEVLEKTKKFLVNEARVIEKVNAGESLYNILGLDKLEAATIDHTRLYDK